MFRVGQKNGQLILSSAFLALSAVEYVTVCLTHTVSEHQVGRYRLELERVLPPSYLPHSMQVLLLPNARLFTFTCLPPPTSLHIKTFRIFLNHAMVLYCENEN